MRSFLMDPDDFWGSDEVEAMSFEGAGLLWWMICRSWRNGGIKDDPEHWKRLVRRRCPRFDSVWNEVRECLVQKDGELRCAWLEDRRSEVIEKLKSDRERKKQKRLQESPVAVCPTESNGIHAPSAGCPTDSAPRPLDVRAKRKEREEREEREEGEEGEHSPADEPPGVSKPKPDRKPASGVNAECIRHWEAEWERTRLGTRCSIATADGVAVAWMLKQGDPQEVRRRMTLMLEDSDPWIAKNASPGLLRSKWNAYAVTVNAPVRNGKADIAALWRSQKGGAQ